MEPAVETAQLNRTVKDYLVSENAGNLSHCKLSKICFFI